MNRLKLLKMFIISLLFTAQINNSNAEQKVFEVTTGEKVYAIGHPIDVIFETQNHVLSLSTLNLDILNKDFVVHDYNIDKYEDEENGKKIRIENLIVRLYPRKAGILKIPAFKLGKNTSKTITLNIVNDFNSTIHIRTTSAKKSYYQREPINIYIDIYYKQKKISSSVGDLVNKNFIISDVKKTEYFFTDKKAKTPVDRYSWIVIPLTEGQQTLELPMIKTGGRRMYPSGELKITVTPLPSTLPILVPVSKQVITAEQVTNDRIWINKVYFWSISVIGNGLNENTLEKILTPQLLTNSTIRYFPRIYNRIRIDNGTKFKTEVKIPFKLYNSGGFQFPTLDIPYIDATTGIIEHAYSGEVIINATSNTLENFKVILIICLFLLTFLIPVLKKLKCAYIKRQYKKCYSSLAETNNPKRLKKYLFNLTPNFDNDSVLTVKSWQEKAVTSDPEQRKIVLKIGTLLNKFNYDAHYTENEISIFKQLVKKLS